MREERLLERPGVIERELRRRETQDVNRRVVSIPRHFERILNTRQRNVPIADDFGMLDYTNIKMFGSESALEIEGTIRHIVTKYELRLVRTWVSFTPQDDDVLALRFSISARLAADESVPVELVSIVRDDGRISITA